MMGNSKNHSTNWDSQNIIRKLPYSEPFLFVEEITAISEQGITGFYTFDENAFFYKGHFRDNPITPGVILTECAAQIGVVCLGIVLMEKDNDLENIQIALSSTEMEFLLPVFPTEKVKVVSEKVYFRFNKLKCKVKIYNGEGKLAAKGVICGMIAKK